MKKFLLLTITLAVAACAGSGAKPDRSEAAQAIEAGEPSRSDVATESGGGETVAYNPSSENSTAIEELEAPEVDEIPASEIPNPAAPESAIVCESVVPTGSILPVKVCRNREDIEKKQAADQDIFDDIKRNTAIGNTRL